MIKKQLNKIKSKMKFLFTKNKKKPFSYKTLTRILVLIIVFLSLLAGFYQSSLVLEKKKYARLEDRYVRVRAELGIDETQRLIDFSRNKEQINRQLID